MAWLKLRGNVWYIGYRNGTGDKYISTGYSDRETAETELLRFKLGDRITDKPLEKPIDDMTLETLIQLYKDKTDISEQTRSVNDYSWGKFIQTTNVQVVKDITSETIKRFRDESLKTFSAASVSMWMRDTRKLLNFAVKKGIIQHSPFDGIQLPKQENVARTLTEQEQEHLLAACNPLLKRCVEIALSTGLRVSQIVHLTWEQINVKEQIIHIPGQKRQRDRYIPISPALLGVLGTPQLAGRVLPEANTDMIKKMFSRAVKKAKIKGRVRFHDLRHTCASRLARVLTPYELRDYFGWSSVALTDRYCHTTVKGIQEKLRKLA